MFQCKIQGLGSGGDTSHHAYHQVSIIEIRTLVNGFKACIPCFLNGGLHSLAQSQVGSSGGHVLHIRIIREVGDVIRILVIIDFLVFRCPCSFFGISQRNIAENHLVRIDGVDAHPVSLLECCLYTFRYGTRTGFRIDKAVSNDIYGQYVFTDSILRIVSQFFLRTACCKNNGERRT